jgi:hypothetical protein
MSILVVFYIVLSLIKDESDHGVFMFSLFELFICANVLLFYLMWESVDEFSTLLKCVFIRNFMANTACKNLFEFAIDYRRVIDSGLLTLWLQLWDTLCGSQRNTFIAHSVLLRFLSHFPQM